MFFLGCFKKYKYNIFYKYKILATDTNKRVLRKRLCKEHDFLVMNVQQNVYHGMSYLAVGEGCITKYQNDEDHV